MSWLPRLFGRKEKPKAGSGIETQLKIVYARTEEIASRIPRDSEFKEWLSNFARNLSAVRTALTGGRDMRGNPISRSDIAAGLRRMCDSYSRETSLNILGGIHSSDVRKEFEEILERTLAIANALASEEEGGAKPPQGDLVQVYSGTQNVADKVRRVSALLSLGADPNVREERGHPLLHVAVNDGHLEVVKRLLEHGADVNATNPTGSTALHIAANWGDGEMVELLLGYKPDVNVRNNAGRTPLDSAALAGPPTETADGRPMRGDVDQVLRRHGGKKGSELSP